MKPITVDEIRRLLPDFDEVSLFVELLGAEARPDGRHRWSGAGELRTVGERQVEAAALEAAAPAAIEALRSRSEAVLDLAVRAILAWRVEDHGQVVRLLLEGLRDEQRAGRMERAEGFANAALRLASREGDASVLTEALLAGARLARASGRWDVAESRYLRVRAIQRDAGDTAAAATALIGLGNLAVDRGRWLLAQAKYDEAEAWVARLAPGAPEHWHLALNRAIVARETGDLDEAERHQDEAEASCGAEPDPESHAILSNARGQLLVARGRLDEAEFAFRRALTSAESSGARVTIAVNLATTLLELGNTLEAGQLLREAEERAIGGGAVPRLPEVYRALGRIAAARGHADALVFFERALELVDRHGLASYERARTLVDYGRFDRERGEAETGRARLEEASVIFQELGCVLEHERTLSILKGESHEDFPSGAASDE